MGDDGRCEQMAPRFLGSKDFMTASAGEPRSRFRRLLPPSLGQQPSTSSGQAPSNESTQKRCGYIMIDLACRKAIKSSMYSGDSL
jgi:hypothetical protein